MSADIPGIKILLHKLNFHKFNTLMSNKLLVQVNCFAISETQLKRIHREAI